MSKLSKPELLYMLMTKSSTLPYQKVAAEKKTPIRDPLTLEKAAYCLKIVKNARQIMSKQATETLMNKTWNLKDFLAKTGEILWKQRIKV